MIVITRGVSLAEISSCIMMSNMKTFIKKNINYILFYIFLLIILFPINIEYVYKKLNRLCYVPNALYNI